MLPKIQIAQDSYDFVTNRLFIAAEGFEKRSIYWISKKENNTRFERAIICKYSPSKKSRFDEMLKEVKKHTVEEPSILEYNCFEPTLFEQTFKDRVSSLASFDEIVIDISVMSKLLIMIILYCLKEYTGKITIIYSEPSSWGPTEKKFNETISNRTHGTCIGLSSVGVGDVVRTPLLSSIVMQNCPILLVTFLSFNEQLINVLVHEISPTKMEIINHKCCRAQWRENAMYRIHKDLINGYLNEDNKIISFDLLDYIAVFDKLSKIYKDNCYNYRIVIAPTGCKLQAVSCALLKICCPDIHVEYPTPESYLFDDYSSDKVANVYEIVFDNYKQLIGELSSEYELNG